LKKFDVGFCNKKCGRPHLNNYTVRKISALGKPLDLLTAYKFYGQPLR